MMLICSMQNTFWILLIDALLFIGLSHQFMNGAQKFTPKIVKPKSSPTNVSSATPIDPSNGVDDILKDTFLLLDVLDEKLAAVNNRTPHALMRDNLRALDGANDDYQQQQYQPLQGAARVQQQPVGSSSLVARSTSGQELGQTDEASIEEALVKMADGFASGRRNDHDAAANEPLPAVAISAKEEPQPRQLINYNEDSHGPMDDPDGQAGPQGSMDGDSSSQQEQMNGAASSRASFSSKRARQLMNAGGGPNLKDNNQLASDSTERHIKFTLDLMQSIFSSQSYSAKTNLIESFLISPLSIQMVLMMMHLGARGQTRREINNCLHLTTTSSSSSSTPISALLASSYADKSFITTMHQQQQQQIVGGGPLNAATAVGNDLGAAAADSMGSKLKRRHQQVSSENAKQQSVSGGNSNGKSQHQAGSTNLRHQQTAPSSSSSTSISTQQQQQQAVNAAAAMGGSNPHELFGGAMRNLLKDPIVMKALTSANQIFLQKNLPLSAQYEWAIKHYYGADVKLVDFQHQSSPVEKTSKLHGNNNNGDYTPLLSPNSTFTNVTLMEYQQQQQQKLNREDLNNNNNIQQMVNDWIERQTKGKISNFLLSPISTSTLMMAINVLYFKGDWQYKFDPSDTETDAWFTQASGKTVKIPMMVNRLPLAYAHDAAMKTSVIELPYKAQRLGLFLLLPDDVSGIFHTMQMLNSTSFANLISSMRKPILGVDQTTSGINVRIPKFSIESSPKLSLILSQQLGLKSLFMPDVADLSGMFGPYQQAQQSKRSAGFGNSSNANKLTENGETVNQHAPLQVGLDELLHKAVLQVDEQGSVAAASSATIVERVGAFNNPYFEADHPFLLFLMDKQTGLVLFSGVFAGNNNNNNNTPNNQESPQQWH